MDYQCQITDQNEFAFTAHCARSKRMQLGFGNIALLMELNEFDRLMTQVDETLEHYAAQPCCPCCRSIIIETSVKNMVFMFSLRELGLLQEVMQRTKMLLEAKSIINPAV
jgi:glutaminase